jgi:long-chain acyl-CoA synthetase
MLDKILGDTVKKHPEKIAFVYDNLRITYKDFYSKVVGLSQGLSSIGINRDCIALILPNCPEFVISFFAVAKLNAIVLPLNPLFKEDEIKYYISDSNASAIITDIKRADICRNVISQLGRQIKLIVVNGVDSSSLSFYDLVGERTKVEESLRVSLLRSELSKRIEKKALYEGDMLYQYSSGSTGRPKRVCRTQKNLLHEGENFTTTAKITSFDNILCIVPLFHAHGLGNCLLAATCTGATLIFLEEAQNSTVAEVPFIFRCLRVLELIQTEQVTILPGVPYMFSALAEIPSRTQPNLSNLRLCFSAGNFLHKELFDKFNYKFGIPIRQLYGCTEAGSVSINLDSKAEDTYDSVGMALKNVEVKIIDEQENEVACGITGEIVIKSQALTSGYYNLPELNRQAFKNGYFFTGDLGKKDENNRLYVTGRKKILIDTGGYKVDPLEIEDILITHPKVKEAVVVGTKEPYVGEIIKAVIVLQDKCNEDEILSYCKDRIAGFKVPKLVEFREHIPKSPLGKILRKNLI